MNRSHTRILVHCSKSRIVVRENVHNYLHGRVHQIEGTVEIEPVVPGHPSGGIEKVACTGSIRDLLLWNQDAVYSTTLLLMGLVLTHPASEQSASSQFCVIIVPH